jgi:glutathione peroxidase
MSFYNLTAQTIHGKEFPFLNLKNKVVLVVNVASACGLTPQYKALQEIYNRYSSKGFVILAFPANNFGAQEPGSHEQIQLFCESKFNVSFQMMAKLSAVGPDISPVFEFLTTHLPIAKTLNSNVFEKDIAAFGFPRKNSKDILWNFEKFLIDRNGQVTDRFNPDISPDHDVVVSRVEALLNDVY